VNEQATRILIMEDDLDLALQWSAALRAEGFACTLAQSRPEAEQACEMAEFDAVVVDVFIKDDQGNYTADGGFTLVSRLRMPALGGTPAWGQTVPIVIVTGAAPAAGVDALEYGLHLGANAALRKPFPPQALVNQLLTFIGSGHKPGPHQR